MTIFKKHLTPGRLGGMIYELLRSEMDGGGQLSIGSLVSHLDLNDGVLHEQFRGDIMIALMFAAVIAIERSTGNRVAQQIISGMKEEFLNHLEEQGANTVQQAEWEATLANSFLLYRKSMEDYSGFEPPWKLGRQLYWNLIGGEQYAVMSIKIATLYLLEGRDRVQELLNEKGPLLLTAVS